MKLLVCGGRDYNNYKILEHTLYRYLWDGDHTDWGQITIISGCAKGADTLALSFAKQYGTQTKKYPADWKQYGKSAGVIRNQQMLDEGKPDLVVAFPGGRGTADMIRRAKKSNIKVITIDS